MEEKSKVIKKGTKQCSTRLQKHAPTFLEINDRPTNPFSSSTYASSSKAIPLLSPLVLSNAESIQTQMLQNSCNIDSDISNEARCSSSMQNTIWKHPAMLPFQEPSSLCNFLQKQCVIANNTHWDKLAQTLIFFTLNILIYLIL